MRGAAVEFGDSRLPERFWQKVTPCPMTGCWLWMGALQGNDYGTVKVAGRSRLVHRYAFIALCGEVPDGLQLDHLCRVRGCCNPHHLEPVTQSVNVRRSTAPAAAIRRHAAVTHCPQGHEYTEENTYYWSNHWRSHRQCRICCRKNRRESMRRKRAAIKAARVA